MGFVPVNFGPPHPAAGEADHDDTLELAPSPGTITFLQAPTSSYAPEAIVSIRVISPMISKYTCHCTRSRTYRSRLLGGMPSVNERADADVVYIGMPLQPCGNIAPVVLGR